MDFRQAYDPVRALGVAWRSMGRAPSTVYGGALLLVLTFLLATSGSSVRWWPGVSDLFWPFAGSGLCLGPLLFLANCLLQIGFAGALQRVMVTGEERFRDLFQDRGLWLHLVLARLASALFLSAALLPFFVLLEGPVFLARLLHVETLGWIAGVAFSIAYAPIFVYVVLGFLLVGPAVAIEGKRPVDAIQRSWEIAEGQRIQLLVYFGVLGLVGVSGVLLCGVGLLLTLPWCETARFESYLRFALPEVEGGAWVDRASSADHDRSPGAAGASGPPEAAGAPSDSA